MTNKPLRTMVCVTVQSTCERLIREGAKYGDGDNLQILHVAHPGQALMGFNDDPGALEYLYEIARNYHAEMHVIRADEVVETIVSMAEKNGIECIVMGARGAHGGHDYAYTLKARLPQVNFVIV